MKFQGLDGHVNVDLQEKLHRAQDDVAEKLAQTNSLQELIIKVKSAFEAAAKVWTRLNTLHSVRIKATAAMLRQWKLQQRGRARQRTRS